MGIRRIRSMREGVPTAARHGSASGPGVGIGPRAMVVERGLLGANAWGGIVGLRSAQTHSRLSHWSSVDSTASKELSKGRNFMVHRHAAVVAMVAGLLGISVGELTVRADGRSQTVNLKGIKCPICGMQASPRQSVEYKGAKVYFGCGACPPRFLRNPSKYAAKANAQLVATKQARQKACPIMGGKPNKELKMRVGGADVFFCCARCKKPVEALKGDAQIEKVFNEKTFAKAFEIPKKK